MELLRHEDLKRMTPAAQKRAWDNFHKGEKLENFNAELSQLQKFSEKFLPLLQREGFLLQRLGAELSNGTQDYRVTVELKNEPKRQFSLSEAIDNGDKNPHRQWRYFSELEDHYRITGTFVHVERVFFQRTEPHYLMVLKDVDKFKKKRTTVLVTIDTDDIVSLLKLEYVDRKPISDGVKSPYDNQKELAEYDKAHSSYSALKVMPR